MNHFETLTTDRLTLRKLSPEVFEHVYSQFDDNALMAFLGLKTSEALTVEKRKYQNGLATFNKSFLYFQLLDKVSEEIIGWCGYHTWYLDHRRAEIGYGLFDDAFKNRGLMSEATAAILNYGFNQMNLHRVEAFIGTDNVASQQLVRKFGFILEGHLKEHYFTNNRMEDSLVFALLRHQYS